MVVRGVPVVLGTVMITMLAVGLTRPMGVAADQGTADCHQGVGWPRSGRDIQGVTFLGRVVPDRFGALRIAVERVFDGRVPSEVVVVRSCLSSAFQRGETLLVSAADELLDGSGDDPDDLRLWFTETAAAIWRVTPTGRLALAGAGGRDRGFPAPSFARPRFVSDVVTMVMEGDAPPPSAFDTDPADGLPPLRPRTPTGPAWQALDARTMIEPQGLAQVVAWAGGFVALGRNRTVDDGPGAIGLWLSDDGVTWRTSRGWLRGVSDAPETLRLVGFRDGIIAIEVAGLRIRVWRSEDGERWQRLPDLPVFGPPPRSSVDSDWNLYLGEPTVSADRLRLSATWHYGICGNHCDDFSVRRVWTTTDGATWRRSRPSPDSRNWDALQAWAALGTDGGFVGLRRGPGVDAAAGQESCGRGMRLWASARGVSWRPIEGTETLCIEPVWLADDPGSGRLFLLGHSRRGGWRLLVSEDLRHWAPVVVPFPDDGWRAEFVSVRGDTMVVVGGRQLGSFDTLAGSEGVDHRVEPLVSMDGGITWTISTGWPALLDGMTQPVVTDDLIVAGAGYPTGAVLLETIPGPP